jgi:membrane protease subunit HflK
MRFGTVLLVLLLLGYALTGVVQVSPGERAVVRRFGRVLEHKPEPGLWVGLPWGMDRVDRVAVDRVQQVTLGYRDDESGSQAMPAGQLLTGDHNLVNVQVALSWKVRPDEVEEYVLHADQVEGVLARVTEAVMAEWVAGRTVDEVLLNGKNEMRPELVALTQERLGPYRLGVQVLDARVGLIAPPDEVKAAFDRVSQAQTGIATRINKAEQDAEGRWRTAQAEKYRLQQTTAAQTHALLLLARQDADNFLRRLRQYEQGRQQNPYYLRQIWEEERGKLFARLKDNKQLGLLDHHLGPDGLDLTIAPQLPPANRQR